MLDMTKTGNPKLPKITCDMWMEPGSPILTAQATLTINGKVSLRENMEVAHGHLSEKDRHPYLSNLLSNRILTAWLAHGIADMMQAQDNVSVRIKVRTAMRTLMEL